MKKITLLLCFCVHVILYAQEEEYTYDFSVHNETYEALTNGTSINNGEVWDDPEYGIPIGFNFQVADNSFNTIYISKFGNGGVLSSSENENEKISLLAPLAENIIDKGTGTENSESNLSYILQGETGSRVLKIEWDNIGFDDGNESDYSNFQVWLYETSNIIEYHYGESYIQDPSQIFYDQNGPVVFLVSSFIVNEDALYQTAYELSNDPMNPTVNEVNVGEENNLEGDYRLNGMIPSGTVYRFKPHEDLSNSVYKNSEVSIYPNPVENEINIHSRDNKNYEVLIYDSLGQLTKQTATNSKVDVSKLNSGLYFVKVKKERVVIIKKFIKK